MAAEKDGPKLLVLPKRAQVERGLERTYAVAALVLAFVGAGIFAATKYDGLAKAEHTHPDLVARLKALEDHADEDRHETSSQFKYIQDRLDKLFDALTAAKR